MTTSARTKPPIQESRVFFITLPSELLCEVTKYLEPSELLKLRLILPKSYHDVLLSLLQEVMRRLYVAPTQISIDNFMEICKSPFFQSHVQEVIFIPRTYGEVSEAITSLEEYTEECREGADYCISIPRHATEDERLVNKSWKIYQDLVRHHATYSEDMVVSEPATGLQSARTSKMLSAGLARLPKLEKVSVCKNIEALGLNVSSLWYSAEYALARFMLSVARL